MDDIRVIMTQFGAVVTVSLVVNSYVFYPAVQAISNFRNGQWLCTTVSTK